MIGAGLAMAYAMRIQIYSGRSIASESFWTTTAILCPIVGAALGLLQVLFESRQGYWAVLVHRPISRQRIFLGKAIAGIDAVCLRDVDPVRFLDALGLDPGERGRAFPMGHGRAGG